MNKEATFEPRCELCGNTQAHIYANVGGSRSCCLIKLGRLERECAVKGWDSYGAAPVTADALEAARLLVDHLCELKIGPQCIVPSNDGGIGFTWPLDGDGEGVTLEITKSGIDDPIGLWSADVTALLTMLSDGVKRYTELDSGRSEPPR